MQKNRWERGGGGFIDFAVAMIGMMTLLSLFMALFTTYFLYMKLENTSIEIGRQLVVCEDMESAQEMADSMFYNAFAEDKRVDQKRIYANVTYAPGEKEDWEKGNYINLYLSLYIRGIGGNYNYREVSSLLMIENSGE